MSAEPLLGAVQGTRGKDQNRPRSSSGLLFLNIFRGGLVAPSETTYDSMRIILNTANREERDELTKKWMDHKLEELNFVGVVGGLLSGCLTSTGAWPDVLSNGTDKPWIVKAFWYSGIICAVFAVLTAAQQGLRLHRLASHRDGLELIRKCMAKGGNSHQDNEDGNITEGGAVALPRKTQVYAWQASLTFLIGAAVCLIIGIVILVWVSADYGPRKRPEDGWWDDSSYLALVFTIVVVLSTFVFVAVQNTLASGIKDER
ncbi:hypothetical protein F5Y15DRAFT_73502 [Xylariaceae sp. FL0016]|nr:hypothetical protein F5Y15DRAFT_73502 [Xylariaceae sp. FL0016]